MHFINVKEHEEYKEYEEHTGTCGVHRHSGNLENRSLTVAAKRRST